MIHRSLNISKILAKNRSAFLFGARGVGKTVLAKAFLKSCKTVFEVSLLETDTLRRYIKDPSIFRLEVEAKLAQGEYPLTVFLDEVQKIPELLDEVHALLNNNLDHPGRLQFLLTGSSARKLRRGGANLLAGRALTLKLHPFTSHEVTLDLPRALQFGTLPAFYLGDVSTLPAYLKTYVETYLKEEIQAEALVRNIGSFSRFLDIAGQMNSEPVNFAKVGRDCGVNGKTVKEYFDILDDTLITFRLNGWHESARKQLLQAPKYFIFDCGVLNALRGELYTQLMPQTFRYGKLFETFVIQEFFRSNDYAQGRFQFCYWRTNAGTEVDLIVYEQPSKPLYAIEIKSTASPESADFNGLRAYLQEYPNVVAMLLCTCKNEYVFDGITVMPWRQGIDVIINCR